MMNAPQAAWDCIYVPAPLRLHSYLLLNLALITLPLYTLTTHTLRADKKLLQQLQDQTDHKETHGAVHHSRHH